jgi:hypothetical protein
MVETTLCVGIGLLKIILDLIASVLITELLNTKKQIQIRVLAKQNTLERLHQKSDQQQQRPNVYQF